MVILKLQVNFVAKVNYIILYINEYSCNFDEQLTFVSIFSHLTRCKLHTCICRCATDCIDISITRVITEFLLSLPALIQKILIMIDEIYYKAVDLLKEMISTPSVSHDEAAAADIVTRFLDEEGFDVKRFGNNICVEAGERDASLPTLLLNSHIDTVRAVEGWVRDPFTPVEEEGRLYGLGSNDAGASVVSLIAAFIMLSKSRQPYNLVLLLSCEEEISGKGGLSSVTDKIGKIDFAVVGEPTGMRPAIAEKGLMVLDGEVYGEAGHAARNEGVNAIYKAMEVVDTLRTLRFGKESPMLGPVKISVTQINAGTQHNVVPDLCSLVVDVRTTDAYSNVETLELIRAAVPQCKLTPRSTRLNPSGVSVAHPLVQRAQMLGLEPFGSPTLSDQALMSWPSLKMGPGDSARSHTADEYICLDEIRQAIEYYIRLLDGLTL